jgi:hypothetical protein
LLRCVSPRPGDGLVAVEHEEFGSGRLTGRSPP